MEDKFNQTENYLQFLFIQGYTEYCSDPELGFLSHQKFNAMVSAVLATKLISQSMAGASTAPAAVAPLPDMS
jgi:hypothetical protein